MVVGRVKKSYILQAVKTQTRLLFNLRPSVMNESCRFIITFQGPQRSIFLMLISELFEHVNHC